jgi:AcrR family transcriptional regulator
VASRSSRPARLTRESRRAQLLEVTKQIAGADGLHAVSIDRVAREAGITRPVVYEHFGDLGGLLEALLDRESERAATALTGLMSDQTERSSVAEQLIAALAAFLEAVRADPVTWRLMLIPPEGSPRFLRERIDGARSAVLAQLTPMLGSETASLRGLSSPDPLLVASSIQALAVHWARLLLSDPETFDSERILAGARWALERF